MIRRFWLNLLFTLKRWSSVYSILRKAKNCVVWAVRNLCFFVARIIFVGSAHKGPLKGTFSVFPSLSRKALEGRILLKDQGQASVSEPSIMEISKLDQNREQPWPIFWARLNMARLCGPGLVPVNDRKEVCLEAVYGRKHLKQDAVWKYCPLSAPVSLPGRWTSVISSWVPINQRSNYSHWLFEALPRLAVCAEIPEDVRILIPPEILPFQRDSLEWLGLTGRVRPTEEKHLLVEDFYFSSPPTMIVCHNPYAVNFLRNRFLKFADKSISGPTRFFLHRPGQFRGIANENEVVEFFKCLGWGIVDTAALSLAQQVQLFSEAEAVVGPHGAGFSNLVWCKPGCKVVELFSPAHLNGCYEWLSYCVKADYQFIISPPGRRLNAQVNIDDLKGTLRKICAL